MNHGIRRTYIYNDRRYGMYQPNGYGQQYPGQKLPGQQYPQGVPIGDDKFKFDPVSIIFTSTFGAPEIDSVIVERLLFFFFIRFTE